VKNGLIAVLDGGEIAIPADPGRKLAVGFQPVSLYLYAESGSEWVDAGQVEAMDFGTGFLTAYFGDVADFAYVALDDDAIALGLGSGGVALYSYDDITRSIAFDSILDAANSAAFYRDSLIASTEYGRVDFYSKENFQIQQSITSSATGFGKSIHVDANLMMIASDNQTHFYHESATSVRVIVPLCAIRTYRFLRSAPTVTRYVRTEIPTTKSIIDKR